MNWKSVKSGVYDNNKGQVFDYQTFEQVINLP